MKSRESILRSMRPLPLPPCFDCRLCAGTTVITVGGAPYLVPPPPSLAWKECQAGRSSWTVGEG
jgi:hypothetical protein